MKTLFDAIYSKFNTSNTFRAAIGGRFYIGEAPDGAVFPYAVYNLITNIPDHYFDSDTIEEPTVQISIYSEDYGAAAIGIIAGYCKTLFDDASLSVTGYGFLSFIRSRESLLREPDNLVWNYSVDYEIRLSK
jgi:hypothetical protein